MRTARESADNTFLRALLHVLLQYISEGVHVCDGDGYTIFYNTAAGTIDGIRPKDAINKHVLDLFPSLHRETSTIMQALQGNTVNRQVQSITNMYGCKVYLESSTLVLQDNDRIIGAVDISRDVTQVKELTDKVVDLQSQINNFRFTRAERSGVEQARYVFEDIQGQDQQIALLKQKAQRIARTNSPVLISGETGTGKELLAHALHNGSPRCQGPFISQNCAAMPASLMEGILFGTAKGSFTGAENRPGLAELADGGTLLLDEITCLDIDLQSKLLRFLQDGFVRRLGEARVRKVNVRVIASTNIPPMQAVKDKMLRDDLFYRLNVVNLEIPPLRERPKDILFLSRSFLSEFNLRFGMQVLGMTPEVEEVFLAYEWPGNVRELRAVIEGALNLDDVDYLELKHLPDYIKSQLPQRIGAEGNELGNLTLAQAVQGLEKSMIIKALAESAENVTKAAKLLGVPRQTLQYKLNIYGFRK